MNSSQLNEIFKCLDKDNSGYIELEEFKNGIKRVYNIKDNLCDDLIEDVFTFIDGYGLFNAKDHRLNKDEVRKVWQKIPAQPLQGKEGITTLIFDLLDLDKNGYISESEFKLYLRRVEHTTLTNKEINNLFIKLQTEIGKISKEKFIEYITTLE